MDQSDPQKRIGMIVDEWGTWFDVEPGTNPGFLYQQNTLRDALVAGVTLNIFNQHAERVKMANIAQTVNVLQAMILTDKEKMLVTPTYHVFEMFTVHHDALLLPIKLTGAEYEFGDDRISSVSASASKDQAGRVHVTLCNLDPNVPMDVTCAISGLKAASVTGRVLTASAMNAHNTFDEAEAVKPVTLDGARLTGNGFAVTLPAKSVVVLELK
jgi:alpha-N-arabinofuranosidase